MPGPDADFATPTPGAVTVVVTVLGDPRVERTIESLLRQERTPEEILVDDGGGSTRTVAEITARWSARDPRVRHLDAPGNIPESRNLALRVARGEFVAFLDADEVAPAGWLRAMLEPFTDPQVGFAGGPTPALSGTTRNIGARFYDGFLRRFYDRVARSSPHALPMGNSIWRAAVFRQVGLLDTTLFRRAASEDQEIARRALGAGWKGVYVPEGTVDHDFSDLSTLRLLRKQAMYAEGGYVVWRRHGSTYEASAGRVLPYVLLPVLALVGLVMLAIPGFALAGTVLLTIGAGGLLVLAAALTAVGLRADRTYPGLRFNVLEIPRRWATLLGAFRGWRHYGASGRKAPGEGAAATGPNKP
ncbi:MAG TPA: glycosyltransferase [Thermoplasmata archaeon]|nr:glycosyltransferase [Thermoplasmata archaeon]